MNDELAARTDGWRRLIIFFCFGDGFILHLPLFRHFIYVLSFLRWFEELGRWWISFRSITGTIPFCFTLFFSFSFCVLLFIYILLDKRTRIAWEGRERMNGLSLHSSFVSRTLIRQVNSVCVIYDLTGALHWVDWVFFFFFLFSILNVWWLVVGRGGIGIQRTNIEGKGSIIKKLLLVWSRYAERAWSNWRNRKIAGL